MLYILIIILSVIADQAMKAYVTAHLELYESAPLIPKVLELYHIRNTGGGFSILSDYTWLLTIVTAAVLCGVVWLLVKRTFAHPLAMASLSMILGGGLGNLIDRVRLGYVVDMFNVLFMDYPVFNIADILVVCGVLAFAVYYLFLFDKTPGKAKTPPSNPKTEAADGDDDSAGAL